MRLTRSGMIDALGSDYIRTARAKGLSRRSIVIETVFALHGAGFLAWESISKNDFQTVQAVVLLLACIYILLTLGADPLNAVLDPRLRAS